MCAHIVCGSVVVVDRCCVARGYSVSTVLVTGGDADCIIGVCVCLCVMLW